ncbi:MAG TPA: diguanylate cyclase [Azonexus sp.]
MTRDLLAYDRFTTILEWLLAVRERRIEVVNIVLVHVCLHDQQRLGDTYGASEAHQMLSDLAEHLRQACRKSDLVARDGTDFWILVPYEVPATVAERVATLVEVAAYNGLNIVDRDIGYYSLTPADGEIGEVFTSGAAFLAHLKAHRQTAYRWCHAEPAH